MAFASDNMVSPVRWKRYIGLASTLVVSGLITVVALTPLLQEFLVIALALWGSAAMLACYVDHAAGRGRIKFGIGLYTLLIFTMPVWGCMWSILVRFGVGGLTSQLQDQTLTTQLYLFAIAVVPLIPFAVLSLRSSLAMRAAERERAAAGGPFRAPRWMTVLVFPVAIATMIGVYMVTNEMDAMTVSMLLTIGSLVVERGLTLQMVYRAPAIGMCNRCGYDLRGLTGAVCPECGHGDGRNELLGGSKP